MGRQGRRGCTRQPRRDPPATPGHPRLGWPLGLASAGAFPARPPGLARRKWPPPEQRHRRTMAIELAGTLAQGRSPAASADKSSRTGPLHCFTGTNREPARSTWLHEHLGPASRAWTTAPPGGVGHLGCDVGCAPPPPPLAMGGVAARVALWHGEGGVGMLQVLCVGVGITAMPLETPFSRSRPWRFVSGVRVTGTLGRGAGLNQQLEVCV